VRNMTQLSFRPPFSPTPTSVYPLRTPSLRARSLIHLLCAQCELASCAGCEVVGDWVLTRVCCASVVFMVYDVDDTGLLSQSRMLSMLLPGEDRKAVIEAFPKVTACV
jgi:hypothetical protein